MKFEAVVLAAGLTLLSFGFAAIQPGKAPAPQTQSKAEAMFAHAKAEDYAGDQSCAECHETKVSEWGQSPHAAFVASSNLPLDKKGCEGCHGPAKTHKGEKPGELIGFTSMDPKEASAACLRCHETTLPKSHWKETAHARADLSCVSCHKIHPDSEADLGGLKKNAPDPRTAVFVTKPHPKAMLKAAEPTLCGSCHPTELGQFRQASHHPVPEGSMTCSDCHSPHPTKASKANAGGLKSDCVKCHTEFAGPFIFEHDPVGGFSSNGCDECHKPHGSNFSELLNSNGRGLCGQCHTDKLAAHYPDRTCWTSGCHVALHGSNTDSHFFKN